MMSHARSAWWLETKSYARIVPPLPRRASATPKEKTLLAFLIWRGGFFLKKERVFFFRGSVRKDIRTGGVQMQFGTRAENLRRTGGLGERTPQNSASRA